MLERVKRLYREVINDTDSLQIKTGDITDIKLMSGTRIYGQCFKIGDNQYEIRVSKHILKDEDIKEVLMHEVLHTVKGCMNHGQKWNRLAELVNIACGYNIERTASIPLTAEAEAIKRRYVVKCTGCGHKVYRQRKSKIITHIDHYRCGRCGNGLILE